VKGDCGPSLTIRAIKRRRAHSSDAHSGDAHSSDAHSSDARSSDARSSGARCSGAGSSGARSAGPAVLSEGLHQPIALRSHDLTDIPRQPSNARCTLRVVSVSSEERPVVLEHGRTGAGAHDDGLGSALNVRPQRVDVALRMLQGLLMRGQMMSYGATTARSRRTYTLDPEVIQHTNYRRVDFRCQHRLHAAIENDNGAA
jgi:hypothetical protein